MPKLHTRENGFNIIEVLIGLAIIATICLAGLLIDRQHHKAIKMENPYLSHALLTITRNSPHIIKNISNPIVVNKLYDDVQNLPTYTSVYGVGLVNCPIDNGLIYTLKFNRKRLTVIYYPTGCASVTLSNTRTLYTDDVEPSNSNSSGPFDDDLSNALGTNFN